MGNDVESSKLRQAKNKKIWASNASPPKKSRNKLVVIIDDEEEEIIQLSRKKKNTQVNPLLMRV